MMYCLIFVLLADDIRKEADDNAEIFIIFLSIVQKHPRHSYFVVQVMSVHLSRNRINQNINVYHERNIGKYKYTSKLDCGVFFGM